MSYLKSKNVEVYPSAYRGQTSDSKLFNPESRLPTEHNVSNQIYNIAGSFIINPSDPSDLFAETDTMDLEFVLHGYWFRIKGFKLEDIDNLSTAVYATIRLANLNTETISYKSYPATTLVRVDQGSYPLDSLTNNDDESLFYALDFTDTASSAEGCYSLHLFDKDEDSGEWKIHKYSLTKISEQNIATDAYRALDEYLETTIINVDGGKLAYEPGYFKVEAADTVTAHLSNWHLYKSPYGDQDPNFVPLGPILTQILPTYSNVGAALSISDTLRCDARVGLYGNTIEPCFRTVFNADPFIQATKGKAYITDMSGSGIEIKRVESKQNGVSLKDCYFKTNPSAADYNENSLIKIDDEYTTLRNPFRLLDSTITRIASNSTAATYVASYEGQTGDSRAKLKGIHTIQFHKPTTAGSVSDLVATKIVTGIDDKPTKNNGCGEFRFYAADAESTTASELLHEVLYLGVANTNYPSSAQGQRDFIPEVSTGGFMEAQYFNATSDKRLKENIKTFEPHRSILDLPIVEFDFKSNKTHHIGCLAQDLQEICPEIVHENKDGYLTIEESKIVYLLLDEVRKLRDEIKELKGE